MTSPVQLALGSVQFGLAYGIAGRGETIPEDEVREVLEAAWVGGIRLIDTAPVYGDIERRLSALAGERPFGYVSKIPSLQQVPAAEVRAFVHASIEQSRQRLGPGLRTLLFHRGDDLVEPQADEAWRAATDALAGSSVRLGGSFYSPAAAARARERLPVAVAQLPGNALDQRLSGADVAESLAQVEIHLRSVFLQGLLLDPPADSLARVPAALAPLEAWRAWCARNGLARVPASLGIARALPHVRYCLIGVDSAAQLREVLAAWSVATPLRAPELACGDAAVIDPRLWRAA
jgi:aryl-alcohol dehydrogenase-like predicted oxidoreductase